MLRFFATRLGSAAAAEDLVQEIYLKVRERPAAEAEIFNPGAYLYRLGTNLMLDRLKAQTRGASRDGAWQGLTETISGEAVAEDAPADRALAARQRLAAIVQALDGLGASQRRAFVLHKLEGLSHLETAQVMGVSKSAVEKYISAVLKHLLERGL